MYTLRTITRNTLKGLRVEVMDLANHVVVEFFVVVIFHKSEETFRICTILEQPRADDRGMASKIIFSGVPSNFHVSQHHELNIYYQAKKKINK